MAKKPRNITAEDRRAAENAKRIWLQKKSILGLNQKGLAELMNVNQGTIAGWLNGHVAIGTNALLMLAEILHVSPSDIRPEFQYDALSSVLPDDVSRIAQKLKGLPAGVRLDIERTIDSLVNSNYALFLNYVAESNSKYATKSNTNLKPKPKKHTKNKP